MLTGMPRDGIYNLVMMVGDAMYGAVRDTANLKPDDIEAARFSWGEPDFTVSWPKRNPNRNLHAWFEGNWPAVTVHIEAHAWKDDEDHLTRKVWHTEEKTAVVVKGSKDKPILPTAFQKELEKMCKTLASAAMKANAEREGTNSALPPMRA